MDIKTKKHYEKLREYDFKKKTQYIIYRGRYKIKNVFVSINITSKYTKKIFFNGTATLEHSLTVS